MEVPATKADGKMELLAITNDLMPKGVPNLLSVVKYAKIEELVVSEGKSSMMKVLFLLVKDFCSSMNLIRNMNEDQMIEAAAMLLEECGNFRLEDYVMMFSMAKKGQFPKIKILDRMDIQIITQILDAYWEKRNEAGTKAQEFEFTDTERLIEQNPIDSKNLMWNDTKGYIEVATYADKMVSAATAFGRMGNLLRENKLVDLDVAAAKKQITANPNYKNNYTKKC